MSASGIFILIFLVIYLVACVGAGWIGFRMITRLGRYPSRSKVINTKMILPWMILTVVSFTLLIGFFKILVSE